MYMVEPIESCTVQWAFCLSSLPARRVLGWQAVHDIMITLNYGDSNLVTENMKKVEYIYSRGSTRNHTDPHISGDYCFPQ